MTNTARPSIPSVNWNQAEDDEILRLHICEGLTIGDAMRQVFDQRTKGVCAILLRDTRVIAFGYPDGLGGTNTRRCAVSSIQFAKSARYGEAQWILHGIDLDTERPEYFAMREMTDAVDD